MTAHYVDDEGNPTDVLQLVSFPIAETYNRPRRTFMRGPAGDVETHWFELIEREEAGDDIDMFYIEMMPADDSPVVYIEGLSPAPSEANR